MVKKHSFPRINLRTTLILCITAIILIVIMFLIAAAYSQAYAELVRQNREQARFTEAYLEESLLLADRGLRLYDSSLDSQLEEAFSGYLDAYNRSAGDIGRINLTNLKESLNTGLSGHLDLYIINESGVIVASTVPSVMHLDFRHYPDFYQAITRIRQGDGFVADRIVRSVVNTTEGTVSGQLRKFAYMPTPDHAYLLELGLILEEFESQRSELSYVEVTQSIQAMNPSIERIRIFDINRNLLITQGVIPHTDVDRELLEEVFSTGRDREVTEPDRKYLLHYVYIDLHESSTASDMSMVAEITYTLEPLNNALSHMLLYYSLIGIIAVVMGIALAYFIARFLSTPINEIIEDVEQIAKGDLDHSIRTMPNPEFQRLEESINLMIKKIQAYSEELEREKAEIRIAAEIQRTFLPEKEPGSEKFGIAARTLPAQEVGGDFYDFIPLDDSTIGLVIADVAGKGVPAALFMALSRSILRAVATAGRGAGETVGESNDLIAADASAGMFVTLFYAILDQSTGELAYVNAGHNPPLHYSRDTGRIQTLSPTGMALGVLPENIYTVGNISLCPGDVLVLYTDGVTEAFNPHGEEFGDDRLMNLLLEVHANTAHAILDSVFTQVSAHAGETERSDDITVVVVKATDENS